MFRKIASNREPGRTLGSELKKEFGVYFERSGIYCQQLMEKYPRQVFAIMIVAMVFSAILAFTVMRSQEAPNLKPEATHSQQAVSGIGQIISTAGALQTLWQLREQVDSLLKKENISHTDSLTLNHALTEMDSLRLMIRRSRPIH